MNENEMIEWIDNASMEELIRKIRFEPIGSPWFQGKVGLHFNKVYRKRRAETPVEEWRAISKKVGWK